MLTGQITRDGQAKLYSWSYPDDDYKNEAMIDAEEARKQADNITNSKYKKILEQLDNNIRGAARVGECYVTSTTMPEPVKAELIKLGYKVEYYPGDPRDSREGPYYTISW